MDIDIELVSIYRALEGRNYHIRTRQKIERVMSSQSPSDSQKGNDNIDVEIIQRLLEQIREQTDMINDLQRQNAELYKENRELHKQLSEKQRY